MDKYRIVHGRAAGFFGQLAAKIVRDAVKRASALLCDRRVLQNVVADDNIAAAFQRLMTRQRMSSRVWVVGRTPVNCENFR